MANEGSISDRVWLSPCPRHQHGPRRYSRCPHGRHPPCTHPTTHEHGTCYPSTCILVRDLREPGIPWPPNGFRIRMSLWRQQWWHWVVPQPRSPKRRRCESRNGGRDIMSLTGTVKKAPVPQCCSSWPQWHSQRHSQRCPTLPRSLPQTTEFQTTELRTTGLRTRRNYRRQG